MKKKLTNKQKTKIIVAIILLICDVAICVGVFRQWSMVPCNGWSLLAAFIFYSLGCYAFWTMVEGAIDWIFRNEDDIIYGQHKK